MTITENKLSYIDLFAGCGGLSLGLYNSGLWKGIFAVEKSPDAFETLQYNLISQKNHFDWPAWLPQKALDINEVINEHKSELEALRGTVDLVAGGPPCQGFSTSGKRNEGDLRNKLIDSYIKFVRLVQPKMIFFENVKGFTQRFEANKTKGKAYSTYVKNALTRKVGDFEGYDVYPELVDFSEFGVPQKRTRFILVGIRKNFAREHQIEPKSFFQSIKENRQAYLVQHGIGLTTSLEEAISDLLRNESEEIDSLDTNGFKAGTYSQPKSSYQKFLRKGVDQTAFPDSHRFANHKDVTLKKFEFILANAPKNKSLDEQIKAKFNLKKRTVIPLSPKTPSATLTTLPDDYLHYAEPRIFTVREYARIQSFNDWYEFKGKYTTGGKVRTQEVPRYSQIGNAIPPLFGAQAGIILNKLVR